jgi:murein DD-endopeptidase MepM/ murein hydrolase activator NlpD
VGVQSAVPDNYFEDNEVIQGKALPLDDPASFSGNYVIIDHQNGEYSLLAHFLGASIVVQEGELVKRGQLLGQVGFSGSTGDVVHLHYELRNKAHAWKAEGLPSRFENFTRIRGNLTKKIKRGSIGTGEFAVSRALYH